MSKAPHYLSPPPYRVLHVAAVQALARGDASPHQQQEALRWIIEQAAGTYDLSFTPDSDRGTSFAEGRRFVGLQIVKLTKLDKETMKDDTNG